MARKYIKNCTGDDCSEGKISGKAYKSSLLLSRIIFFILLAGFISVSIFILLFSPYLQVTSIEITGNKEIKSNEITQKIESLLQEKYLGVFPKNNFLFISQKKISEVLMADFKKIRSVAVTKKFPDSIVVNIDERSALLIWCGNAECYLLDESGLAYNQADFNSPEVVQNNLLKINDASGREIIMGEKVVEPSYEKFVLSMKDALAGTGFDASGEYFTPSRMADEIHVKTLQGPELYFSMQFPLEYSVYALNTVFKKEIPADKKNEIEYIDLRSQNKVFYKFKNQQPQPQQNPQ